MKKLLLVSAILILGLSLVACSAKNDAPKPGDKQDGNTQGGEAPVDEGTGEYHKISAEEAKARMDSGDTVIVVDVRTKEEYDEAHIEGAILVPNETIGEEAPAQLEDKDAEILVYCRSGRRSKEAAEKLVALGYTAVYDFGGIIDWPYETVSE